MSVPEVHRPSTDLGGARTFHHTHLLGTIVEIRVVTDDDELATSVDHHVVAEMSRLQSIFSAFDEQSELCRWRRGERFEASPELGELLAIALDWQHRSRGGFNPAVGVLVAAWREATVDDRPPDADRLAALVESIREPRFRVVDGVPVAHGDCSLVDVNAIAKGYIVDRSLAAGRAVDPTLDLTVNAGGDLAHHGAHHLRVGIEDPSRPYDNEPPLTSVHIRDEGLATSGRSRRGVRIDGRWYGHVIDPATGMPVDEIASITVVAADAVTADVLATVAGVRRPADAVVAIEELGGRAGLVVDRDGRRWPSPTWPSIEVPAGSAPTGR